MSITGLCFIDNTMISLKPLPGRILVELREKYEHVATTAQKYDTKTSGICIDVPRIYGYVAGIVDPVDPEHSELIGQLVFWDEYKDGAVIERDDKKYAFIKIEDLDGFEDVEAN